MRLLAIDPGTTKSGWVLFDADRVIASDVSDNLDLMERIEHGLYDSIAIEHVQCMGMSVGEEVLRTVWWTGRFAEAAKRAKNLLPIEVPRKEVKMHLCNSMKAKDKNIRQALLDRYGGKAAAIGCKAKPGPMYGITTHKIAALAVAVTVMDKAAA